MRDVLPAVEAALQPFGARPHWGKLFTMEPAAVAAQFLERNGPIDFGFDESALIDPVAAAESLGKGKFTTTNAQASSSLAQSLHSEELRQDRGPQSLLGMNQDEFARALQLVRDRVEREYNRGKGGTSRLKILASLKVRQSLKKILQAEY